MAFQSTNAQSSVSPFPAPVAGQNTRNKADAFINIYLPRADGSNAKVGALAMHVSKPVEKQILDYIADAESPESAMERLKDLFVLDFKRADGNNGAALAL